MEKVTFTHPECPGVTFEVIRGSMEESQPSNTLTIIGTKTVTPEPTEEFPEPESSQVQVCKTSFWGP